MDRAAFKYPDMVFPTLVALKKKGGSATIEEIEDAVAEIMGLSDEMLSAPHGDSGQTEFQYKLAWVRNYLKKYGALENSERGVWAPRYYSSVNVGRGRSVRALCAIFVAQWLGEPTRA